MLVVSGNEPGRGLQGHLDGHRAQLVLPGGLVPGRPAFRRTVVPLERERLRLARRDEPPADADPSGRRSCSPAWRSPSPSAAGSSTSAARASTSSARTSRSGSARRSSELNSFVHVIFAVVAAGLAGAAWAGIAGILKATVGAHEVITTIMLNWIAYFVGLYLFGQGGPLQNPLGSRCSAPRRTPSSRARSCRSSGETHVLQGLHVGLFVALGALVVFWIILNRTTLGYEVRAVGFNPEAAALRRHLRRAQLLPGDGHLGRLRRPRRRGGHARLALFDRRLGHPVVTSASPASPSRCSVATRRSASASPRSSSRALRRHLVAQHLSGGLHIPEQAGNLSRAHPGARPALRRRRLVILSSGRAEAARVLGRGRMDAVSDAPRPRAATRPARRSSRPGDLAWRGIGARRRWHSG